MKKKLLSAALILSMLLPLAACGSTKTPAKTQEPAPSQTQPTQTQMTVPEGAVVYSGPPAQIEYTPQPQPDPQPEPQPQPQPQPEPAAPTAVSYETVKTYWSDSQLTQEWGKNKVVEHLFFHPVIAYPKWAFFDCKSSASEKQGLDEWMVTADEFKNILQHLYDRGYILVRIEDVWSEYTNEQGESRMQRNVLKLPEGKKPLIISFDDVNYYDYMLAQGFTSKLVLGSDGEIWAECRDPYTGEVFLTQELDATPILDRFVLEHPDFSLNGAKAIYSLTGFNGILGYHTESDYAGADRNAEIAAVKPIIRRLKETGWTFGCHTYSHRDLSGCSTASIQNDISKWIDEVVPLTGETAILFYPYGGRPDGGDDVKQVGEQLRWMQSKGFRVFCSVGFESYSQIKKDIALVICDRMHPDGKTLRDGRSLNWYKQFYDPREIIDLAARPDYGTTWAQYE